jgi:rhamnosyltransferase
MKIQLIIPILNPEPLFFSNVIPRLQSQTLCPDILLINSGKKIPSAKYGVIDIEKKDFNHANTRNIALTCKADFYLFMTQDATPYDSFLVENLLKNFVDEDVVVSYAKQIPYKDADAIELYARTTNYPDQSKVKSQNDLVKLGIKTFFSSDSCAMYRGSYFREVGGFTPDLNTNEDMEFAVRAIFTGKKIAYCANAKVWHSHNFTLKQIWQRYSAIGKFFKENNWILQEVEKYATIRSSGREQAKNELKYLLKNAPLSIPRSILVSLIKYIAFQMSVR